jgi:YidC/Oxa1 family membrane protein insertase
MQQKRLLLALAISTAILFIWSYLYPVKRPQQPTDQSQNPAQQTDLQKPSESGPSLTPTVSAAPAVEDVPRRTVTITTPLAKVKIDTRGAEVISWKITQNKNSGAPIYSSASTRSQKVDLELISPEGLRREPREVPFQVFTGDNSVDGLLQSRNYKIEDEAASGDVEVNLTAGQKKQLQFVLRDSVTGLDVVKSIGFDADAYNVDFSVNLKRGTQPVPQVKLRMGPSIGDQGVGHYTFYSVAPEAVVSVNGKVERHAAASINGNKNSPDRLALSGQTDWAAIGDTYFTMVGIPPKPAGDVEVRTIQYNHQNNGKTESRYLLSALLSVPADGSRSIIYVGPKDHYLLTGASQKISQTIGRSVELEGVIDYGFLSWLSRPLAVPILWSITALFKLTGSYGVAIILFTIVIYSLFFPLKWRSSKAMKKAQKLAPKMKELQEKIKGLKQNDPRLKELQVEQLRLMKEGNPLGGCLPLLIQMPFLFALYRAITISLDFRQATFLWLPDLSSGDPFHILEIMMAGTMIVLQLITPAPSADPLQRKMMAIGMPIFMLYVLWGAPSGLLLYWLVGNIVGFSQQFLINHLTKSEDEDAGPPAQSTSSGTKKKKLATAGAA